MLPLEGNRWMAMIGGHHGDAPPGDAAGLLAYARELRTRTIYNAITVAKQVGEPTRHHVWFGSTREVARRSKVFCNGAVGGLSLSAW
jgi:hypothetical protein